MFDARLRPLVDRVLDPVGAFVARLGVTANQVSFAGFGLGIAAAIAVALDFLFYSAVPFAFAVADPANAMAAAFLIFSFVGTGSSVLAFAIIAQKRGISTEIRGKKGFFYLGGLTEGSETIIFLLVTAFQPDLFVPLAWAFGCLCWITTITRVRYAIESFSDL